MKKILSVLCIATLLFASCSDEYDDSALTGRMDNLENRVAKLEELCKDVRVLRNADRVLPEDDNLLDNQDLCLLFKVSIKTLQRYRAIGALPYFTISGKSVLLGFRCPGVH